MERLAVPDPAVVTNPMLRDAIIATGFAWRVRDNGTNIEMLLVPAGAFNMGCSPSNQWSCSSAENPIHAVTLTNAFYIGRYEVTQGQWLAKMGSNPAYFKPPNVPEANLDRPIESVAWQNTQNFMAGTGLRLPTNAEWEFAYRAGTTTAFHGFAGLPEGTDEDSLVGEIAWYGGNNGAPGTAEYGTKPVGQKAGNGFGLHDMSGNVWEWVSDWYDGNYYGYGTATNPPGPASGVDRILRGGAWSNDFTSTLRSSTYGPYYATGISGPEVVRSLGFRVARTAN